MKLMDISCDAKSGTPRKLEDHEKAALILSLLEGRLEKNDIHIGNRWTGKHKCREPLPKA